jgi:hypothetical protein
MIVLLAPGGKILAITSRTTGELPGSGGPHAGLPTASAAAATERINSEKRPDFLPKILFV